MQEDGAGIWHRELGKDFTFSLGLWPREINWPSHVLRKREKKNPFLLPFKVLSPAVGFNFVLSSSVGALSSFGVSLPARVMEETSSR